MKQRIKSALQEIDQVEDVSEIKKLQNLGVKLEELSSALDILKNAVVRQYFYIDEKVNSSKYEVTLDKSKSKFS